PPQITTLFPYTTLFRSKAMLIHKAYKFRIYPNKNQEVLIAKTIGCSRFVFNHFLAKWKDAYEETGKGLTYTTCSSQLTQLKKERSEEHTSELQSRFDLV